eukprot:CAMPEP_0181084808 /NCGR_PEP_ID=MMETSP1071-20121207/4891_1 /TAXON_ID=35127 /ORGANISM="Thalassiosira sp., Strain NH16" /LENGTH=241 /DNA_ID=CAMNT_0023166563 /DNA_START=60 /DNA_END=785 /DNA_ORIENTATION=+
MADEQTSDFFNPPADDSAAAFAAPPSGGDDSQIGDIYYGTAPDAQVGGGDFFNPPPADDSANAAFAAPPAGDAPIILGDPSPYEAPAAAVAPGMVEAVSDDEEEDMLAGADSSPVTMDLVPAEPTAMAKWNEEWQQTLLARKEEENAIKAASVEKAREDIAAFQAEREKRRESRMAKNRSDEQDKLEAIEADLENDNSWQRAVKMIELNQDSNEGAADTGRMKDVLVLLKNEPARADALSA